MHYILVCTVFSTLSAALNPFNFNKKNITDISQTTVTSVAHICKPHSIKELQKIVQNAKHPISIAGGRFSQGGHISYPDGILIDMTGLHAIKHFDRNALQITVEAGITWRAIQNRIAPYNCAVKVMQSYNDFTVGGSLSVNVHGRDIHYGPLIETIISIQILLADGQLVTASRSERPELFAAAIGGYGAVGIITQATISLTTNTHLTQDIEQMPIERYPSFFQRNVLADSDAVLHNANLYPPDFTSVSSITWYKTHKPLTIEEPMQAADSYYVGHMLAEQLLRRVPLLHKLRPSIDLKTGQCVVTRNYEMSSTVNTLEPLFRIPTTTILQEYFIPLDNLLSFVKSIRQIAVHNTINIINISIRYVSQNNESLLSYSKTECFSLVLYINIMNTKSGLQHAKSWTRDLIDVALELQGSFYLPYQLFGSLSQLQRAYPRIDEFRRIKKLYDPTNKFMNNFLEEYNLRSF